MSLLQCLLYKVLTASPTSRLSLPSPLIEHPQLDRHLQGSQAVLLHSSSVCRHSSSNFRHSSPFSSHWSNCGLCHRLHLCSLAAFGSRNGKVKLMTMTPRLASEQCTQKCNRQAHCRVSPDWTSCRLLSSRAGLLCRPILSTRRRMLLLLLC